MEKPIIKHNTLTKWNWMVSYPEHLILGENVDIGAFTYIQAQAGIEIGDDVKIGSHCSIYSVNTIDGTRGKIIIEPGSSIGAHSVVLPKKDGTSLTIGAGAKCGAFSLIKTDIRKGLVVVGGNRAVRW